MAFEFTCEIELEFEFQPELEFEFEIAFDSEGRFELEFESDSELNCPSKRRLRIPSGERSPGSPEREQCGEVRKFSVPWGIACK